MSDKPSTAWYLAPIFLGIIGSAIMWFVLKDEDHPDSPKMIKKGWIIGIVLTVLDFAWIPFLFLPLLLLPFAFIGGVDQQHMQQPFRELTPQQSPFTEQKTIPPETLTPPPKQSEISTPKQEETPSPSPLEQNEKEEKTDVSQLTVEELEELSISWDYKDILRNIEKYEGKIIHLTGFIWRVEAGGGDRYVLTVWAEPDDHIFYVDYTGSKLLYADTIEVYVTVSAG